MSVAAQPRYRYPQLDNIEDLERYQSGGFHSVSIGDVFGGRYKVLHKLGFGGSSTVWLAQDQRRSEQSSDSGCLITLKVMSANQSYKPTGEEIADLYFPHKLHKLSCAINHPGGENLLVIKDHFSQEGPNGTHLCLISQLAGPSVFSMAECPGRVSGSRRLRGGLAKKVTRQVATVVELMHSTAVIHGGLSLTRYLMESVSH